MVEISEGAFEARYGSLREDVDTGFSWATVGVQLLPGGPAIVLEADWVPCTPDGARAYADAIRRVADAFERI